MDDEDTRRSQKMTLSNSKRQYDDASMAQVPHGTLHESRECGTSSMKSSPLKRSKTANSLRDPRRSLGPTSMARAASYFSPSTLSTGMPPTSLRTGLVSAPPPVPLSISQTLVMGGDTTRLTSDEIGLNNFGFPLLYTAHQPNSCTVPILSTGLDDIGMDPSQYLQLRGYGDVSSLVALPTRSAQKHLSLPHTENFPAAATVPALPSTCGSLTEDATLDTATSTRLSESYHGSILGTSNMMRIDSQDSFTGPFPSLQYPQQGCATMSTGHDTSVELVNCEPVFSSEEAILGVGAGYHPISLAHSQSIMEQSASQFTGSTSTAMEMSLSFGSTASFSYHPAANLQKEVSTASTGSTPWCFSADMERSVSSSSARSTSSLSTRAKDALRRQNNRAKRIIQPRTPEKVPSIAETRESASSEDGLEAIGESVINIGKKEIAKTKYTRPKHEKLKCNFCDDYPQGFRGEHELRRHQNAKHSSHVTKFICRDPRDVGQPTSVDIVIPLSQCKQCSTRKKYGAYYNAAAHLRRSHFKNKAPRKGSSQVLLASAEEESTGCWPAMHEIKGWIEEIIVPAEVSGSIADVDETGDLDEPGNFGDNTCTKEEEVAGAGDNLALVGKQMQQAESVFHVDCAFPNYATSLYGSANVFGSNHEFACTDDCADFDFTLSFSS